MALVPGQLNLLNLTGNSPLSGNFETVFFSFTPRISLCVCVIYVEEVTSSKLTVCNINVQMHGRGCLDSFYGTTTDHVNHSSRYHLFSGLGLLVKLQ